MNDDALRQLTHDRRQEREAQLERLSVHARRRGPRRADETAPVAGLALLLAARRHAIQ